ncbi:MAG: cytosine deaminase [Verrucomicrobiota bacterium]
MKTLDIIAPIKLLPEDFGGESDFEGLSRSLISIEDGVIKAVRPWDKEFAPDDTLRLGLVLPEFLDSHTHLDKTHSWGRAPNVSGTFQEAIENLHRDKENWTVEDVYQRSNYGLQCAYGYGTVALRSHVDTGIGWAERSYEALAQLREEWRGKVEVQLVSLASVEDYDSPIGQDLADLPVGYGAKAIGGMPVMNPKLDKQLDRLFQFAAERKVGVDLHVDESGDRAADCLRAVALAVMRNEFMGTVVCGHCCSLAVKPIEKQLEILRLVKEAGIRVVSLPMCNMYLQDRKLEGDAIQTPYWRGITLAHEFMEQGTPFACASDNVRDAFYAYGDYDMLEVYRESLRVGHLDRRLPESLGVVTSAPARLMDLDTEGFGVIRPGSPARLASYQAESLSELLSRPCVERSFWDGEGFSKRDVPAYSEIGDLKTVTS